MKVIIALGLLLFMQDKNTTSGDEAWTTIVTMNPSYVATFDDKIEKGIYTAIFRDPNNEWRCYGEQTNNGNMIHITCVKPIDVPDDSKKK